MRYALIMLLFLASCATKYAQVYTTSSDLKTENNSFVFENDTLRIVYFFWGDKGELHQFIQNKLKQPLYIDWGKSSMVYRNNKLPYYSDNTRIFSQSITMTAPQRFSWVNSFNFGTATVVRNERVTFIPPNSFIEKGVHFSLSGGGIEVRDKSHPQAQTATDKYNTNNYTAYVNKYDALQSPVFYRNFITYSVTESFQHESYVDNSFFVSKVETIPARYFNADKYFAPISFYNSGVNSTVMQ